VLAVSSDGLHLASSDGVDRVTGERFSAITAGLASLTLGAAECFNMEPVIRQVVEMRGGYLLVARINERATLALVTARGADLGQVGYEMTLFIERVGQVLSPELIDQLKNAVTA
jgi:predicted regulator of Ras-like GTPase activity (Roadblock/LC7/MglB family)